MIVSGSKRVLVLDYSNDNVFDLQENTSLRLCPRTRFETEANSNSEMGYFY